MKDKRSRLGIRIHGRVLTVLFLRILPCCTQFSTSIELRWGFLRLSHWPGCTTVKGRRSKEKRVCAKGPLACEQDYVNAPVLGHVHVYVCVTYRRHSYSLSRTDKTTECARIREVTSGQN